MHYRCWSCGRGCGLDEKIAFCPCGGFFTLEGAGIFSRGALKNRDRTIWRYREAFGLPEGTDPVTMGEGHTPLVSRKIQGSRLSFKLDYLQPSGSFKDRGASVLLSLVRALGVTRVVEDSSGNAGAAVSAYAAAAGIACRVFVPGYTPAGKLTQIRLTGAEVLEVPGTRQDTNEAAMAAARGAYYASHLWNPFFARGLQSAAFEIWEDRPGSIPPRLIVPVGSGGYLEGLYLGFRALKEAGYAGSMPALIGVQTERCRPIHQAFLEGKDDYAAVGIEPTVAEGIAVQKPPRAAAVLRAVRDSGGMTISVSEAEILAALRILFSLGLFVEPTSASVLAAWLKLPKEEREDAVLVLTGSGLKETRKLAELFPEP